MTINSKINTRFRLAGIIVGVIGLALLGRLFHIQVIAAQDILKSRRTGLGEAARMDNGHPALRQYTETVKEPPMRGRIYCIRNGRREILASTVLMPALNANPQAVRDASETAGRLASILERDRAQIYALLSKTRRRVGGASRPNFHVRIAEKLTSRQVRQIREMKCPALSFEDLPVRVYPGGKFLSAVVGFVGKDEHGFLNRGLEGIEGHWDEALRGKSGTKVYITDAARRRIGILKEKCAPAKQGDSVVLTIHPEIQQYAEDALDEIMERWTPQSATAVVMDPATGDILAMANRPCCDPNNYAAFPTDARRNRAVTDTYEPGSTIKPVTAAILMQEGMAGPDTKIKCFGLIEGRAIRDHCSGWLSLREVIVKSSNRGAARMGLWLYHRGVQRDRILRFGFGQKTGIDFPGESPGRITSAARWSKSTAGSVGFGHEISVTPLQLARAYCVFANGGMLVRPRLVKAVIETEGRMTEKKIERPVRVLDEEVALTMLSILADVVESGTGKAARVDGRAIGGKTGTAEIVVDGVYCRSRHVGTFVGIGPIEKPRLVVLISVNDPKGGKFGGTVAAPSVGEIFRRALKCLEAEDAMKRPKKTSGTPS